MYKHDITEILLKVALNTIKPTIQNSNKGTPNYIQSQRTPLYLYVYNYLFIKKTIIILVKMNYLLNNNITCDQKCD
jgi:hypothetical protein